MTSAFAFASPFKGLAPFDDSDTDALLFFGRARDTETIVANLQAARLTVLFGPSGVGKSSVLRAGVIHRLRLEPGVTVVVADSWADDPTAAVQRAAHVEEGELYLILDQFEEYFTYHGDDGSIAAPLADLLARPAPRANVLISIREDMLARLDAFKRDLPEVLGNRLRLERLDRRAAAEAIRGPIEEYNRHFGGAESVRIEPELVEAVLDEVRLGRVQFGGAGRGGGQNGATADRVEAPFLQLVLERLWQAERREGSQTLRLSTFRRLGGALQIVGDHLEAAMAALTPAERETAAAMYDHLVTPSGTKIAHGVGDLAGYAHVAEPEAAAVLGKLARDRILRGSSEDGSAQRYEIFHDVLADAVLAWRARHEEERAVASAHEQRRRARLVAAAAVVALMIVAAIAIFALVERTSARSQAHRARAQEFAAKAVNASDADPAASVRFAYDAARLQPGPLEEDVLRRSLLADRLRATLRAAGPVTVVDFSHDGKHALTAGRDGKVRIYRTGAVDPEHVLDHGAPVTVASFGRHDRRVLSGGGDGVVRLWDPRTGARVGSFDAAGPVRSAAFGPRGLILTAASNGTVRVWRGTDRPLRSFRTKTTNELVRAIPDPAFQRVVNVTRDPFVRVYSLATGRLVGTLRGTGYAGAVSFSPDGKVLLTSDYVGHVRLWRAATLRPVRQLRGGQRDIEGAAWTRDGTKVAAASADGTGRLWDVASGTQIAIMLGHTGDVTSVAFSPGGEALVTTSSDRTARVWGATPADGGRLKSVLAGHNGPVTAAVFSPDGRYVLTAGADSTARLWDPGSEPELAVRVHQVSPFMKFAVAGDARRLAVVDADGVVQVRSASGLRLLRRFRVHGVATDLAIGPHGPRVVAAPDTAIAVARAGNLSAVAVGGTVRLVRGGGSATRLLHPRGGPIHDLAFSPDGDRLALAMDDATAQLWDVDSGRLVRTLRGHALAVLSLAFSSDGKLLATGSKDHDARIWDVASGRPIRLLHGHFGPIVGEDFSPDGRWLATAGPTTVGLWETATGKRLAFLSGPSDLLAGVAFVGRRGRLVVTASRDGTLRTYSCDLCGGIDELLALAKRRLSRD